MPLYGSLGERFWRGVARRGPRECWPWLRSVDRHGYGAIRVDGKNYRAHRLAWEARNGPIPDGMWVLHRCDSPLCCNPEHLFLGTHTDNMADMVAKGRARAPAGESHPRAKLTAVQVSEIRSSRESPGELARRFGISAHHASAVRRGVFWRD